MTFLSLPVVVSCLLLVAGRCAAFSTSAPQNRFLQRTTAPSSSSFLLQATATTTSYSNTRTELPDSLQDAAERAAQATTAYAQATGGPSSSSALAARCRVDFDTRMGDETYTLLKTSTEFMQNFVSALSYAMIPKLVEYRQAEIMAKVKQASQDEDNDKEDRVDKDSKATPSAAASSSLSSSWNGPTVRIYFPDEGSAALARRDWLAADSDDAKVPICCQFSSCNGVQQQDVSNDEIILFYCPNAAESDSVEAILQRTEETAKNLRLSVFVNPNLVDMGVTGFGLAGRRLRERLLDTMATTYYLKTQTWGGAMTKAWPNEYSIWQEDADANGGYKLIHTSNRFLSNPEVTDIYEMANSADGNTQAREGGGLLDQLGDFVNGMMRL